ncbi:MAG: alpha-glucosidase [Oscillospiraceae bacterium]|nr:alpha-glucosidase [Oscillospiraceae bacterium]
MAEWYKDMSFYHIWPRSFKDGNGDGIGDLAGVMEKLDYIQRLGVDGIWFSPLYPSPNADYGYDVADYRDIHPDFGTLAEFRALLDEVHRRGMKLLMDLVVNHTSDEHPWFQASRRRQEPYTDYYIWRPAGKRGKHPNNWDSLFEGKAWEWDELRGEYYLHLFAKKQPDLNMDNPAVRKEVENILRFWLEKGVDGFREDVITFISKTDGLPDDRLMPAVRGLRFYSNGPRLHAYLKQFRAVTDGYDCMTVGEAPRMTPRKALAFIGGKNRVLDLFIHFEHMAADCFMVDYLRRPFSLRKLKGPLSRWQRGLRDKGWNVLYLENHDHPRVISRYGSEKYRVESGKMLAAMYLLLQGTAFVYQGQELGMTNLHLPAIEDYPDVSARHNYLRLKAFLGEKRAARWIKEGTRVNARTPVQWTEGENAGFCPPGVEPWLTVNPNYREINAADQENDPDSLLNFYRSLLRFRKEPVIRYGSFIEYCPEDRQLYVYDRAYRGERILVVCSFTEQQVTFREPYSLKDAEKLFGNYPGLTGALRPYEVRVYRLRKEQ